MSNEFLPGSQFIAAICKALDIDPDNVQRVVIDGAVGDVTRVYVQYLGTKNLLTFDFDKFIKGEDVEVVKVK